MNPRYPSPIHGIIFALFILSSACIPLSRAAEKHPKRLPDQTSVLWSKTVQQGYSAKLWMNNQLILGKQAFDDGNPPPSCGTEGIGCEYPAGSCIEHLYAAGLWFGGIQDGIRKVTEGYNGDNGVGYFVPERKDTTRDKIWRTSIREHSRSPNRKGFDDDGDGKIDQDELDGQDNDSNWIAATDDIGADGIPDSLETGCKGGYDPVLNADPAYDDFSITRHDSCHQNNNGSFPGMVDRNRYTEKNGIPDHGEPHVDEDFGAVSESDIYCAATDTFRVPTYIGHKPLGIKTFLKSYAWPEAGGDGIIINDYYFINISQKPITDAYISIFADVDVGPVGVLGYFNNDYAAFDTVTKTAYCADPVDRGATPIGFTMSSGTPGASKQIFRWWKLDGTDIGTVDSVLYDAMSGAGCGAGDCIQPDQPVTALADTRLFLSQGPFALVAPGDTVHMTIAVVLGYNVEDMLRNAARARRIIQAGYGLPVAVRVEDSGNNTLSVLWDSTVSPYGEIASYRVYYGTASGHFTDSVDVQANNTILTGLNATKYYFAVRATDEHGNVGPISDEVTNSPLAPTGIEAESQERSINVRWRPVPNAAGYNIYRSTNSLSPSIKINPALISDTLYMDRAVIGDTVYQYRVTAVGKNGFEGQYLSWATGTLIPPARPHGIACPGPDFIKLVWKNAEADLRGFNIYRFAQGSSSWIKLNPTLQASMEFTDYAVSADSTYSYRVVAIDSTGATSPEWNSGTIWLAKHDNGVLFVSLLGVQYRNDSLNAMINRLFPNVQKTIAGGISSGSNATKFLGKFSTVVLLSDVTLYGDGESDRIKGYLLGNGKLLIAGRLVPIADYPTWLNFLNETFGLNSLLQVNPAYDFAGASGWNGFPDVSLRSTVSPLNNVDYVNGIPSDRILYSYKASPPNPGVEGKTVGVKSVEGNAYWVTFPLDVLRESDAGALLTHVLAALGEQTTLLSVRNNASIPAEFHIYDAYPNPFNPSTRIRFDLPEAGYATVAIYDLLGRQVEQLFNGTVTAGTHELVWSAPRAASGVYFYRVQFNSSGSDRQRHDVMHKIILMK